MPFPSQVNTVPAIGVEGDFASTNPRAVVNAGPGGLVAGASGVIIGRFAWIDPTATGLPVVSNVAAPLTTAPDGFVHRDLTVITLWLADATMIIPQGSGVSLFEAGDFFARNSSGAAVARGAVVYAALADGTPQFVANAGVNVATKFTTKSAAAAGELVKISTF
jgi:predicted RecA/RadA family phage recombinase